jgi:hypothetical protein
VPGRNASHSLVRGGVVQGGRYVGGREQGGQVPEVEVGLDEVGEGQGGGGVGRATGPRGVEHGPHAREIAADHDTAAHLDDGRVAAGPGRQVPQCPAARGDQAEAQLLVGGPAGAEHRDAVLVVGADDTHLVGTPVADRPERIGVAPQELGADRVHGLPVAAGRARRTDLARASGGTAPSHQPPHRRLHRPWTTRAPHEPVPMLPRSERAGGPAGPLVLPRCAPEEMPPRR